MKLRLVLGVAVASSLLALVACGGAKDNNELFAGPGSSDLGSDTNPTLPDTQPGDPSASSSGGGSSTSSTSGGGSSTSSSGSSSGGSTSSTSSGGTSGGTKDAGSTSSSSGGTSTPSGVWCGEDEDGETVHCAVGTACCAKGGPSGGSLACSTNGLSCIGGLAIKCDDQSDCPTGQVCCGTFHDNFGYQSVQCQQTCNLNTGTTRSLRFCDPKAAKDECTAIGKSCESSQSLPGYSVCR